jgi:hypothetical protein
MNLSNIHLNYLGFKSKNYFCVYFSLKISQIFKHSSPPAEASLLPSGDNAKYKTLASCPSIIIDFSLID